MIGMLGQLWPVLTCPGSDLKNGAQLSHHPALSPNETSMLPTEPLGAVLTLKQGHCSA